MDRESSKCTKQAECSSAADTVLPEQEEYLRRWGQSPEGKAKRHREQWAEELVAVSSQGPRAGEPLPPKQRALTQLLLLSELPVAVCLLLQQLQMYLHGHPAALTITCWVFGEEETVYLSSSRSLDHEEPQRHSTCGVCMHQDLI